MRSASRGWSNIAQRSASRPSRNLQTSMIWKLRSLLVQREAGGPDRDDEARQQFRIVVVDLLVS